MITTFEEAGNKATIGVDYTGVLAADLPNGMKTGDVLRLTGRSDFVFNEGKISRITDYS